MLPSWAVASMLRAPTDLPGFSMTMDRLMGAALSSSRSSSSSSSISSSAARPFCWPLPLWMASSSRPSSSRALSSA